ncbi:DUF4363 family protein [Clostridium saccharobutylicum]|uniref:DUF4363 family protein n=1 Tax=Clostridium saccharobutylicum DSM 13864 TaxID=1345695 RepID=U5MLQ1_CLOSA|nr:DUF4363 family protein [Clostridium saccharobutylicum]AGX41734.1 hypothetical protein CLSA_c07210 [Clostridium saccharobutylicum DSM 13864]AQR89013.1 hypothetical protein CLOSC_07090 [Clostridium saccharobutylicum]AQR98914.1 hypothetical protein CSACC_07160 [Clostridium saccharobutylicum]AQS08633.1 hypothetical protein CLOBY_07430 [Clostridium saccharobutylicum]AQS12902.1 hypothetical protein CLOSACC_07160 [Clostridium saccharobutylicum]
MRNALLSITLFILTMICVYFLNSSVLSLCDNIEMQAEDIELKITSGQMEEAYNGSLQLLNCINEKNILTSLYLSHQEFDNLLNESVRLSTYLVHNDETEAHTSLHLVKHNTEHIKKLQMSSLENIF